MSIEDPYEIFLNDLNTQMAALQHEHYSFQALLAEVNALEEAAKYDSDAAKKLLNLRKLEDEANIPKLRWQISKKLNLLDQTIEKLNKQRQQAEQTLQVPLASQNTEQKQLAQTTTQTTKQISKSNKRSGRLFV